MTYNFKGGLSYFPFDIDFMTQTPIKRLRRAHSYLGVCVYMALLSDIYKNGYFVKVDSQYYADVAETLAADFSKEEFDNMIEFMIEQELFDERLYREEGVLTSWDIQETFLSVKKRTFDKIPVDQRYILKDCEEVDNQEAGVLREIAEQRKEKEIKEKKSEAKENINSSSSSSSSSRVREEAFKEIDKKDNLQPVNTADKPVSFKELDSSSYEAANVPIINPVSHQCFQTNNAEDDHFMPNDVGKTSCNPLADNNINLIHQDAYFCSS